MRAKASILFLLVASLCTSSANAQLLPDKAVSSVGKWTISTAIWGVGCVAHLTYDEQDNELSISGETKDDLVLLITVNRERFDTPLAGSSDASSPVEIALASERWGDTEPYGFRGTSGVVFKVSPDFLAHFKSSKRLKVTELGKEKLSIPLGNSTLVLDELFRCFDDQ